MIRRNVKRFRGGLVFKARRLVYHPTPVWRIIKKRRRRKVGVEGADVEQDINSGSPLPLLPRPAE